MISASNASSKRTDCPKVGMLPKPNLGCDSDRRMHQCGADHRVAQLVDNHSRAAFFVSIGVKPGARPWQCHDLRRARTMLPRLANRKPRLLNASIVATQAALADAVNVAAFLLTNSCTVFAPLA
jgi:hypothetical protein